ncbi:cation transporter [Lactobacillus sp. LC28-10]|uniref:Cation transporter n=1 Tax=Secundilactobacillus angelensis TaxID=2722706 RepID=A0ABX1L250_9LACO|nr:cation diffusion facilitator family transporter [Secundilactobacillus angelensis]MCH5462782.1 cation diffusion facilitator family transporter [Secundilactobacillus angelensis]NLR19552.1 cation transporter [Secundilactobacillus angelensis]
MSEDKRMSGRRFLTVTILNGAITVVEAIGGLLSGSLSLLSDAFHNLGDTFSIVISYIAHRISLRDEDERNTFGYGRAQILAAMLNALLLIVLSIFLVVEAAKRLSHPEQINGELMMGVATIGLLANLVSAILMHRGSKHNLNMKATYLHLLSDTLSSVGVIFGAVMIQWYNITMIDPIITIIVAAYITFESWPIVRHTITILMQGAPKMDYDAIKQDLMKIDGVTSVHHIHIWMIDENRIMFSAHINMRDMLLSEAEPIYHQVEEVLAKKYGICHVTLQAEDVRGRGEEMILNEDLDKQLIKRQNED